MKNEIEDKFRRGENVTATEILECFKETEEFSQFASPRYIKSKSDTERLRTLKIKKRLSSPNNISFDDYLLLEREIRDLETDIENENNKPIPF